MALQEDSARSRTIEPTYITTSRRGDFFTEDNLAKELKYAKEDWPAVAIKELVDNALDAAEDHRQPARIEIEVGTGVIAVRDDGPGMPKVVIERAVNFASRTSSRKHRVVPSRGRQGNAIQTILAIPYVLKGQGCAASIATQGKRHDISIGFDHMKEEEVPAVSCADSDVIAGTKVEVNWPCQHAEILERATPKIARLVRGFSILNPHLSISLKGASETLLDVSATTAKCHQKFLPHDPTSAHWYSNEQFVDLLRHYRRHDREKGEDRSIRSIIWEFDGLSGKPKAKLILDAAGMDQGERLSAMERSGDIDSGTAGRLLDAMKRNSRPIKPDKLGPIGRDHILSRFKEHRIDPATFEYKRIVGETESGKPFIVEAAFAVMESAYTKKDGDRILFTGVNWSPSLESHFGYVGAYSFEHLLEKNDAGAEEPIVLLVSYISPGVQFEDRAKAEIWVDKKAGEAIETATKSVLKKWSAQRQREIRDNNRLARRREAWHRQKGTTVVKAAAAVIGEAYFVASGGGKLPANARQVMYAARGRIQEMTGKVLVDDYFTQRILPDYIRDNPELTAAWDVVFDARGHLWEPHTEAEVALGTLDVRRYLAAKPETPKLVLDTYFPTAGPMHRYSAILFIEKEGFMPLFRAIRLAERYDIAIMSTKGLSSTAARLLVDRLCGGRKIPLLVLHDFDKSGLLIKSTLHQDTRRFEFKNDIPIIDLGVRLEDVKAYALESEEVLYGKTDPRPGLRESGATAEEIAFLCRGKNSKGYHGQRVEINAFTSDKLQSWIESELAQHGIKKVIPDAATLEDAWRRAIAVHHVNSRIGSVWDEANRLSREMPLPPGLAQLVSSQIASNPELPWDRAISDLAKAA